MVRCGGGGGAVNPFLLGVLAEKCRLAISLIAEIRSELPDEIRHGKGPDLDAAVESLTTIRIAARISAAKVEP